MDFDLKKIWEIELDILDKVDSICRKHDLRYSIAYGSMIGAVRHGGFIPWDDDIDIFMPRADYEKLLAVWNEEYHEGFILQNKYTDWDFTQNFTKIRKDNTTYIQTEEEKNVSYHTGIFIDVFPGDKAAKGFVSKKTQALASAVNLLIARGFTSPSGGIQNIIEKTILKLPLKVQKKLYAYTDEYMQKWNGRKEREYYFPSTIKDVFICYPADMFDKLKDVLFESRKYKMCADADTVLKIYYGDYLKLPPEEERVLKHHPLIADPERNFRDI